MWMLFNAGLQKNEGRLANHRISGWSLRSVLQQWSRRSVSVPIVNNFDPCSSCPATITYAGGAFTSPIRQRVTSSAGANVACRNTDPHKLHGNGLSKVLPNRYGPRLAW